MSIVLKCKRTLGLLNDNKKFSLLRGRIKLSFLNLKLRLIFLKSKIKLKLKKTKPLFKERKRKSARLLSRIKLRRRERPKLRFRRIDLKRKVKTVKNLPRMDLFLVVALFIIAVSPFFISRSVNLNIEEPRQVNLYLSHRFKELLGEEMIVRLIDEFYESKYCDSNADIQLHLVNIHENAKDPDIIIFDEKDPILELYLSGQALVTLNDYVYDDEHIHESDDDCYCIQEIVTVPLVSFMDVLFYNIDVLSNVGFDRPPKNRQEYLNYARVTQNAGFYSDELTPANIHGNRRLDDFARNKAAMIIASTRAIPYLRDKMGDDVFGLTVIPYESDNFTGRYNINLTGIDMGINVNCENKDIAWSFINFLLEQNHDFCELFKAVPGVVSDIIPGDYVKGDPFYSKAWDIFEYNKK